jgi:AcrR family transcriptional regulator
MPGRGTAGESGLRSRFGARVVYYRAMDDAPAETTSGLVPLEVPLEPDVPEMTLRARKRHERRDRVFEAAVALIVEKGFDETSMNDVATRSGLSRTTVFNHFPRKMAFLDEWALRRRQRAASSFAHEPGGRLPLRDVLGSYLAALAALNLETRRETAALMPPRLRYTDWLVTHPLERDLAELVIGSGVELCSHAGPSQVGRMLAIGYFSAVMRWIDVEPAPFDLGVELADLLETVLAGALAK